MSRRVGLALSGGIARGPAHLGVIAVLEREGIPIDVVAGVSAGSLVGALYCAGLRLERLQAYLTDVTWPLLARPVWPRYGYVTFDPLEAWIRRLIGSVTFADLQRPLAIGVTDLETGEAVTLCEGDVARAVHASCAVPGFVAPVEINGRWYGDGGVANNLPVAAVRNLGADYVIGVDLFLSPLRAQRSPLSAVFWAVENFVRRSGGGLQGADCLIAPTMPASSYFSFSDRAKRMTLTLGMRAAAAKAPEIRAALCAPEPA